MPDNSDKTEQPTSKKRKDARKEGNIFQSKEIVTVFSLLITFFSFNSLLPFMISTMENTIKKYLDLLGEKNQINHSDISKLFIDGALAYAIVSIPMLIIAGITIIIPTIAQTKGLVTFKSLKPKFSAMNPIKGIQKMFSLKGFVELLKSMLKIILLLAVIYNTIKKRVNEFPKFFDIKADSIIKYTGDIIMDIVKNACIAFLVIAVFDYMYQRWEYEKNLKMSKQEVKDEYKNTEGDPKIKGKIKQKQTEMSRRRMMQAVPEADVIIRNPTHYAIALKYDTEANRAPIVVAKGEDYMALKIIELAEQHNIAVIENKPLARALYAMVDLDREIPVDYYQAVAEILAVVYRIKKKELK